MSETADFDRDLAAWNEEKSHVDELLYMARNLDKLSQQVDQTGLWFELKGDEQAIMVVRGSGIVELKATGVTDEGGSRGVGFRVTRGISYRAGAHNGTYVSRREVQRIIDSDGTAVITTSRVVYTSPKRNRTWEYSKTLDVFHSDSVAQGMGRLVHRCLQPEADLGLHLSKRFRPVGASPARHRPGHRRWNPRASGRSPRDGEV